MVANPTPPAGKPQPARAKDAASEEELGQITNSLVQRILKSGPPWLRWTALLLAALAPYAKYPVTYLQGINIQRRVSTLESPYSPGNGVPDLSRTDPTTRVDLQKRDNDDKHIAWHHEIKNEDPTYVAIYDNNEKGLLAYKVFDSDGCLLVKRAKSTLVSTFLVRSLNGASPGLSSSIGLDQSPLLGTESLGDWEARAQSPPPSHGARLIRVQAGCLNPHPGQFRYWYGPPADQCWVPMFRQFTDGCTHYQMFNRCNGVYEAQVHWTVCVPTHSW